MDIRLSGEENRKIIESMKMLWNKKTDRPLKELDYITDYIALYILGGKAKKSKEEVKDEFLKYFKSDSAKMWQKTLKVLKNSENFNSESGNRMFDYFADRRRIFKEMAIECGCTEEDDPEFFEEYEKYRKGFE